jgi:hypothetical protein
VGALAGACSKFFTTPIANIVTRKQTAAMISARAGAKSTELSVSDIASTIRSEKGIQGFWSGYSASLVSQALGEIFLIIGLQVLAFL